MPSNQRWIPAAEQGCLAILLVWLAMLPLPFGSVIERARLPLIVVPISVCFAATLLRLYVIRDRMNSSRPTRAWSIWGIGALCFIAVGALQLLPLPPLVLAAVSPGSRALWSAAERVASLAGVATRTSHPISIDPAGTAVELFRVIALFATFTAAALLVRTPARRLALAAMICAAASFEAFYGLRQAALQRYDVWGWVNKLIFNRITGTFVNPNHYAHYLAIALPMALFIAAVAWHRAGPREVPLRRRVIHLIERELLWASVSAGVVILCVAAILLAQSRGGLLSLGAGMLIAAACLPGRRLARVAFGGAAGLVLVVLFAMYLGTGRTIRRFAPSELELDTLVGRRIGIDAGVRVWRRFPLFGSGLGTFPRAVYLEQREALDKTWEHVDNDYVEIAATTGTIGALIAIVSLFGGAGALLRMTFGRASAELSWGRRAFQAAALTSLAIAMVHALIEHNFFLPSNPATLAAIVGAAVSVVDHDKRTRR